MTEHYLDRLARTINANWDAPALTDFYLTEDGTAQDTSRGNRYTYGEMYMEMLRLGELFKQLGLQKGDHIAICGANSAHWAIAYLAIAAYQGVSVTILHTQSPEDIARQIVFSDAKALFTDELIWKEISASYADEGNKLAFVISLADWSLMHAVPGVSRQLTDDQPKVNATFTEASLRGQCHFSHGEPNDLAMICFTSGSTTASRGIMLSNNNISNNSKNITDGYPDGAVTVFLSVLPMAHIYGFMTEIVAQLLKGKQVYILMLVSISSLITSIQIVRPYALSLIPFMVSGLMRMHQDCISLLKTCKQIYIGGSLFDPQLEQRLLENRVPISVGYGMTECGPLISYSICAEYKSGTCGKIVEGMTARIAPNGEILVKGENVMLGYYKNPEATAQKIDADGWLHTGDRGYLDEDGYLYVEGRLEQDMIVLPNGENIHPDNIESKINALEEVKESIVLAREGKLIAIVVISDELSADSRKALRLSILRSVNAQLPMYAQLYDIEWSATPLARTAKQTLKRHLYK